MSSNADGLFARLGNGYDLPTFDSFAPSPQVGGLLSTLFPAPPPPPQPSYANALIAALLRQDLSTELHTSDEVGHIAGVGELHPERLTLSQIRSLCGEVMRHRRRMKGEG